MDAIQKEVQRVIEKAPGLGLAPSSCPSSAALATTRPKAIKTSSKSKEKDKEVGNASVMEALDELVASLEEAKRGVASGSKPAVQATMQSRTALAKAQKVVGERHKEYYNALSKLGKSLDKKFPMPIDGVADANLFKGDVAQAALDRVVRDHLERTGDWDAVGIFEKEAELSSSDKLPPGTFQTMVETIDDIKRGNLSRAISWAEQESDFLLARGSHLAFALHRSQMIRIALGHVKATADGVVVPSRGAEERDGQVDEEVDEIEEDDHFVEAQERMALDPDGESVDAMSQSQHHFVNTDVDGDAPGRTYSNIEAALHYGRRHFRPTQPAHLDEMKRLFTFILFLPQVYQNRSSPPIPLSAAQLSVVPLSYHGFLDDAQMHSMSLLPLFQREFTARMGVSRDPPLKVAVEVGAGGALNRIIKVKTLMKERGNEWSQADELPVEVPLPPHLRFHSVFTCPVSKEQGTEENPPTMMTCGHVVCLESLNRLAKGTGRVKCPYCPIESRTSEAKRVYF
ncbi:hypothetical protein FA10DRAFT_271726 [Acaromyces ingoldii]|uniref:GID complex catalytic subunit 2 n=1 Tax=Acaromyces ingoldii TaxID=215250 RepID=A0A316YL36_9BASI|nr:hypothetical protein FA10DRAFT_271726 [Acaromyces ingoldii]PWN89911.1 hypothetical protein FA10DRAFT_271726 [Acaromyces ingoldii]